jgi:hypothetical protein
MPDMTDDLYSEMYEEYTSILNKVYGLKISWYDIKPP